MLKRKWADTLRDYDQGFENLELGFLQALMAPTRHQKDWNCQIEEATAFGHSDRLVEGPVDCNGGCLEQIAKHSSLNQCVNSTFSEHTPGVTGSCFDKPLVVDPIEKSTSLGNTSSYSLKNFGRLQFAYSLKSACSDSHVDESEAMRKWKQIKQNGFLTYPHGGVPMPEPQYGKKSKRKTNENDQKRRLERIKVEQDNREKEMAKKEHDNKKVEIAKRVQNKRKLETAKRDNILKTAPSTGLLSRISTGIIRRVKNYEEVHAILEDMVRLEQPNGQIQTEFIDREESGCTKIICETNYHNQLFQSLNRSPRPPCSDHKGKGTLSEDFDERSCPEVGATTSCISDYYKKLSWVLTTYSDIISRKCDSILSVEDDLNRSCVPPNSGHGHISHNYYNFEDKPPNPELAALLHDSENCEESFGHDTVTASQFFMGHDKNSVAMISYSDITVGACDGGSYEEQKISFSDSKKGHLQ